MVIGVSKGVPNKLFTQFSYLLSFSLTIASVVFPVDGIMAPRNTGLYPFEFPFCEVLNIPTKIDKRSTT